MWDQIPDNPSIFTKTTARIPPQSCGAVYINLSRYVDCSSGLTQLRLDGYQSDTLLGLIVFQRTTGVLVLFTRITQNLTTTVTELRENECCPLQSISLGMKTSCDGSDTKRIYEGTGSRNGRSPRKSGRLRGRKNEETDWSGKTSVWKVGQSIVPIVKQVSPCYVGEP